MADDLWGKSVTPSQNNQTPPEGMPEGMQAGQVNDAWRENTAYLRRYIADLCAEDGAGNILNTAGTGSAYTLTVQQQFTGLRPGMRFLARAHVQNNGACTLTVTPSGGTAFTAKSIKLPGGFDPKAGDILQDQLAEFAWNATADHFELTSPVTAALVPFWQAVSTETSTKNLTDDDDGTLFVLDGSTTNPNIRLPNSPRDGYTVGTFAIDITNWSDVTSGSANISLPGGNKVSLYRFDTTFYLVTFSYANGGWTTSLEPTPEAPTLPQSGFELFTSSGTFAKSNVPEGFDFVTIHCYGGGGGGGGSTNGTGGGGGGYARARVAVSALGASETVTIGAGGSGGTNGGDGGQTSLGTHCVATGGSGGKSGTGGALGGSAGGVGTTGDILLMGGSSNLQWGGSGSSLNRVGVAGNGAGPLGGQGGSNNDAGRNYGGGGCGANNGTGQAGAPGAVLVEWF